MTSRQAEQAELNLRRWTELLHDKSPAGYQGRLETDRHGHLNMSPPASTGHGRFEFQIGALLEQLTPGERP